MVRTVSVNPKDSPPPAVARATPQASDGLEESPESQLIAVPFPGWEEGTGDVASESSGDKQAAPAQQLQGDGLGRLAVGPNSWFLSRYDQTTLAGLLLVSALAMIVWSAWQAARLRTGLIEIDRARRTELRFEVDLNTAPAAELATLPGVGPKLAAAIVSYREEQGKFSSIEQLLNVSGIGEVKLKGLLPFLRPLDNAQPEPAAR